MNKGRYILMLFPFFAISLVAQDYVLTTKGDTLKGKISFQQIDNIEQVSIKGDKKQTLSSLAVREAKYKGNLFRPVQFSGKVQMMQVLSDGYLSLMAFQPNGVMNYDGRLLALRAGGVMEVPTIGFKKHVANFLSEAPELASQIKDGDLDRKDLDKIIEEFNSFIDKRTNTQTTQLKVESKTKTKLEVLEEIESSLKETEIESKNETLEMLTELKDKIVNNKSIPQYLGNALKENLKSKPELVEKLNTLLQE